MTFYAVHFNEQLNEWLITALIYENLKIFTGVFFTDLNLALEYQEIKNAQLGK